VLKDIEMVKKTRNKAGFFMSFTFSKNLIDRTVSYFKEKYNQDISDEVANEYLRSFSGLFLAFVRPSDSDGEQSEDIVSATGDSNTRRTL
jgi:hypothetical protein